MKRLLSISVLSLFLLATTEMGQILKLPVVFQHYHEHLQTNSTAFIDFLLVHYIDNDEPGNDSSHDMAMPFKRMCHRNHVVIPFYSDHSSLVNSQLATVADDDFETGKIEPVPPGFSSDVFQPPKA